MLAKYKWELTASHGTEFATSDAHKRLDNSSSANQTLVAQTTKHFEASWVRSLWGEDEVAGPLWGNVTMLRLVMILVLLSTFSTISTARSGSLLKTPVSTCCPPGTLLAIEDFQKSEQDVLGKWIVRRDDYEIYGGNSPLLALHNYRDKREAVKDHGRHNFISWVYCVPDLNNLPPIDGFAGSSYPHTIVNGTKPLADEQILQSTGHSLFFNLLLYLSWLEPILESSQIICKNKVQDCLPVLEDPTSWEPSS